MCVCVSSIYTVYRDGAFNWGGEKFRLLQLQPTFSILSCKPSNSTIDMCVVCVCVCSQLVQR